MKKYILFLPFVFIVICSSVFLPRIKLEITLKPQSQSSVKAEKANNSVKEKTHCVIVSKFDVGTINKNINAYYDQGYSLKGFSVASTSPGIAGLADTVTYFAAVCKE